MRKNKKLLAFIILTLVVLISGCSNSNVNSIKITGENQVLLGETLQLHVTVDPAETDLSEIKWKTSDKNIASVENGVVTGHKLGLAIITASIGKTKATHKVMVVDELETNEIFTTPVIITENPVQFDKVEIALVETVEDYIADTYNPYDYNQIHVYGEFESPSGEVITAPAFWYRDYEIKLDKSYSNIGSVSGMASTSKDEPQGLETVKWTSDYHYRLRFLPNEAGNWKYKITVREFNNSLLELQTTQTIEGNIEIASDEDPTYRGIIAIDQTTNRNFTYGDGSTFIPVGLNMCWWTNSSRKTFDYDVWFEKFSTNGGNMVRLWMATWGFSLHWGKVYNNFDDRQNSAARLDKVIGLAEDYDIYVQLCLINHGQFSSQTNPLWDDNPYNAANGGILTKPEQFFYKSEAKEAYKNELMYIIGRYGYSDHIMAWELFNEVDWTDNAEATNTLNIYNWHKEMAEFVEENDSYDHLITTSYKSTSGMAYRLNAIDYVNPHDYGYSGKNINDVLPSSQEKIYSNYKKPVLSSEIGVNWQSGVETAGVDPKGDSIRQSLFAGFMGGGAGGAMQWWWDSWIHPNNLYHQYKGAASFASKLDLTGNDYQQLRLNKDVSVSNENAGLLGYSFSDRIYGYVYNKDWFYYSKTVNEINSTISIPFSDGNYTLTFYNTLTGETLQQQNIAASGGKVNITIPSFSEDIAFIIE